MRSNAWCCDECGTVVLLEGKPSQPGWFEIVRHFDDGFVLTSTSEHYCGLSCLAAGARSQAA